MNPAARGQQAPPRIRPVLSHLCGARPPQAAPCYRPDGRGGLDVIMNPFGRQQTRSPEGDQSACSFVRSGHVKDPGFSAHRRSNFTIRRAIFPIAALLLGIVALTAPPASVPATGQEPLSLGIDADAQRNGPLTLNAIDQCVAVSRGDVFDVDVYIQNVQELLAWEVYVEFDAAVLEVVGRDVEMFLAGNPGSSVLDVSGGVPDPGLYRVAAADTSDPPTPDSGSGVLFRLSLKALTSGTSDIELISRDINDDGLADIGPLLRNVDADILGDTNGDSIFDGPIRNAEVAVDAACEHATDGTAPDTSSDGGGVSPVLIAIAVAGGAVALLIAGVFVFRRFGGPMASSGLAAAKRCAPRSATPTQMIPVLYAIPRLRNHR